MIQKQIKFHIKLDYIKIDNVHCLFKYEQVHLNTINNISGTTSRILTYMFAYRKFVPKSD